MAERAAAAPLAVVFDLDDTLFDAFGQCVGPAHREAALAMCAAGLEASPGDVLARRLALAGRSDDLETEVARSFRAADAERVARAGWDAFYRRDPGPLTAFPFAETVLDAARSVGPVTLLTAGDPGTQRLKLERLGLAARFDEVLLVDPARGADKRAALGAWLARAGLAPGRVLVVGDRPASEIAAALAWGCRALRIRGGEWAAQPTPWGVPEAPDVRAVLRYL